MAVCGSYAPLSVFHPYGALALGFVAALLYGLIGVASYNSCDDCPRKDEEIRKLRDALKETRP